MGTACDWIVELKSGTFLLHALPWSRMPTMGEKLSEAERGMIEKRAELREAEENATRWREAIGGRGAIGSSDEERALRSAQENCTNLREELKLAERKVQKLTEQRDKAAARETPEKHKAALRDVRLLAIEYRAAVRLLTDAVQELSEAYAQDWPAKIAAARKAVKKATKLADKASDKLEAAQARVMP